MSFDAAKDFEKYARDCVKLAEQPNTPPELRQQLFQSRIQIARGTTTQ